MRTLGRRMLLSGKLLTTHAQTAHQTSKKQLYLSPKMLKSYFMLLSPDIYFLTKKQKYIFQTKI